MKQPLEHSAATRADRSQRDAAVRNSAALESPVLAARGLSADAVGNRALLSLLRSGHLQRKARVSQPGDPLEHQADRAAAIGARGRRPAHAD